MPPWPWHSRCDLIRPVRKNPHGKKRKETHRPHPRPVRRRGQPARGARAKPLLARPGPRGGSAEAGYTAKHIEVLEGLEPVRRRPGMYIGGTDEKALHHLFAEVIDNAMDEALAGHAHFIEVELEADGFITVTDNGRGIPVDPHPKFPKKSALEVIMMHAARRRQIRLRGLWTSGGLHGVGVSVANALSERMEVEVARGGQLYRQVYQRGKPKSGLEKLGKVANRRGTKVRFKPDAEIFGAKAQFNPLRLFKMARAKAYLFGGVEIRWSCAPELLHGVDDVPAEATFHFAEGLEDYLKATIDGSDAGASRYLCRQVGKARRPRRRRMGGRLCRRRRRLPLVLLQHHPDRRRRHPRIRACAAR